MMHGSKQTRASIARRVVRQMSDYLTDVAWRFLEKGMARHDSTVASPAIAGLDNRPVSVTVLLE